MEYYFDTSSLVALSRYYHPFDKENHLYDYVKSKFLGKELVILDVILNETKHTSKGIALKAYSFIEEKKDLIVGTVDLMPYSTKKFDNMVDKNFAIAALLNNSNVDYSLMKQQFLNSGDGKLILTMYNRLHDDKEAEICIVTEESRYGNDGKLFKKIPAICDIIGARCITLVDFLNATSLQLKF